MKNDKLDLLLYAWLAEPDEPEAQRRFTRYFRAAYPEICRYVRSFHVDASTSEDLAQRALIKLFAHLGTERRAADARLCEALQRLLPLGLGDLHRRAVERFRGEVRGFRDAALRFRVAEGDHGAERWMAERAEINGRVEPLRTQALRFLDEAALRIGSALIERGVTDEQEVLRFVAELRTVRDNLPALAIPSNGLLYTIAKRLFLDSLRTADARRSRRLIEVPDEEAGAVDREYASAQAGHEGGDLDSRYRAFLEFLRLPLTRAEARAAQAASTASASEARAAGARVAALLAKHERLLAVLQALHESPQPSEEEIGRRLALTRNQVKYVIETVRAEFMKFFPEFATEAQRRRKRVGVIAPVVEEPTPRSGTSPSKGELRHPLGSGAQGATAEPVVIVDNLSGEQP